MEYPREIPRCFALKKDFEKNWTAFPKTLLLQLVCEGGVTHLKLGDLFVAEGKKVDGDMDKLILLKCDGCGTRFTMP